MTEDMIVATISGGRWDPLMENQLVVALRGRSEAEIEALLVRASGERGFPATALVNRLIRDVGIIERLTALMYARCDASSVNLVLGFSAARLGPGRAARALRRAVRERPAVRGYAEYFLPKAWGLTREQMAVVFDGPDPVS